MNPPFSKKNENEKEYHFIQHALAQMATGGLLFAIIPTSVMIKSGVLRKWRKQLLADNTLLSVITFPDDLFYPVGTRTLGIFIKKGIPHDFEKSRVLWAKIRHDGFVKSKGRRLPEKTEPNELHNILNYLKIHLYDNTLVQQNIPEKLKICPIDISDKNLELMPEVYLDEAEDTVPQLFKQTERYVLEYLAFLIKNGIKLNLKTVSMENQELPDITAYKYFPLNCFCRETCRKGSVHSVSEISEGKWPLVSCKTEDNGIACRCDVDADTCIPHCLSIAGDGSFPLTAYYHCNAVNSYDNVSLLPLHYDLSLESIFFLASRLNRSRWRYSYGRKCYSEKVKELHVRLPVNDDGQLDEIFLSKMFEKIYGWKEISAYIHTQLKQ